MPDRKYLWFLALSPKNQYLIVWLRVGTPAGKSLFPADGRGIGRRRGSVFKYNHMRTFLIFLLLPGMSVLASAAGDPDLPPCPSSPNCVSSRDPDPVRRVDPIPFRGTQEEARKALEAVVRSLPRSKLIASSGDLVRAEFRSLLGFVDDVEFRIDGAAGMIHVRSSSRKGYWDLGVNRRRVEAIREAFGKTMEKGSGGGPEIRK